MTGRRKKLGEILQEWGTVSPTAISEAMARGQETGKRIGEMLVEMGHCSEDDVTKALARQYDMEFVDLDHNVIGPGALELIPEDIIKKHRILPVSREDGKLKVIITDPLDLETIDMLRFRLNVDVECCLASQAKVKRFLDQYLGSRGVSIDSTIHEITQTGIDIQFEKEDDNPEEPDADEAPIIRLVSLMITEACRSRASDIHIEPMNDRVRIRYRIDGVCIERDNVPKRMQNAVISRIKIMAGIDIAEKRLPQDGRIKMRVGGEDIDFRVSSLPGYHGESVVLRILREQSAKLGVQALGFEEEDHKLFQSIIKRPNGIFLVTGPTGSGKTTTLYAALNELNRPDRKIITAEDPVEYNFSGINQCQVMDSIGRTFPMILRAMLRQAPNIILVGEIRDVEVADVAIQAALTGHLVFSTLHTNDAPSAITRLIDMGVKPFLVASSIQAIMAQRLVRVICKECKQEDPNPDKYVLRLLGITERDLEGGKIYKGAGCSFCNGTGYHGRQGIFEVLQLNTELRELAFNRAPTNQIRKAAKATGMRTLLNDGKMKILHGITTPEEMSRITQAEELTVEEA